MEKYLFPKRREAENKIKKESIIDVCSYCGEPFSDYTEHDKTCPFYGIGTDW